MKRSQEIQLKQSELRQKANELTSKAELTTEERSELDTTMESLGNYESQYRAAVKLESEQESEQRAESDGEGAERNALEAKVRCARYVDAAIRHRPVDGVEAELNASYGINPMNDVPWSAIVPEARADVAVNTDGLSDSIPKVQHNILSRVFARSATAFIGTSFPSVPVGSQSWPVMLTGTDATQANKGVAVDAKTATFESHVLTPLRLSASYLFSIEDLANTRGIEQQLRSDLSMAFSDAMDKQVLTGDGTAPNVAGFLGDSSDGLTLPANEGTPVATFAEYKQILSERVDGLWAHQSSDVRVVINPKIYQTADVAYRTNQSDESALEALKRISGGLRVSANMPVEKDSNSIALCALGNMFASVAPVWNSVRFIRDEITNANKGQIKLTAVALWNFKIIRKEAYAAVKLRTTT